MEASKTPSQWTKNVLPKISSCLKIPNYVEKSATLHTMCQFAWTKKSTSISEFQNSGSKFLLCKIWRSESVVLILKSHAYYHVTELAKS